MVPDLPADVRKRYDDIVNIGVVCVVLRLKRSISPHFWVNIVDPRFDIPGVVEFSNLRPIGDTVVYVPYYMPVTHPKFVRDDKAFRDEAMAYLGLLRPDLGADDLVSCHVGRLRYAQPVCPPGSPRGCLRSRRRLRACRSPIRASIIRKTAASPKACGSER